MDISGPRVTPSRPDYWTGTPGTGGTFTRQQEIKAAAMQGKILGNRRRYDLPERYTVRITLERGGHDLFTCPVVSCTRDRTRLCIIAPNGMETWTEWKHG